MVNRTAKVIANLLSLRDPDKFVRAAKPQEASQRAKARSRAKVIANLLSLRDPDKLVRATQSR